MNNHHEYMIHRTDGEWFDLPYDRIADILRPATIASRRVDGWGSNRIVVEGEEISFSDEEAGVVVRFATGATDPDRADQIMEDVRQNIEAKTGQGAEVIQIT
jgi:hypothetical protein